MGKTNEANELKNTALEHPTTTSFIASNKAKVGRQHESTILEASLVVSQSRYANFPPGPPRKLVPLSLTEPTSQQNFRVHMYTHERTWVTGKAMANRAEDPSLWVEADMQIEGGTSGGPIIDDQGNLVGIVSHFSIAKGKDKSVGLAPRPHLAMPVWVRHQVINYKPQ